MPRILSLCCLVTSALLLSACNAPPSSAQGASEGRVDTGAVTGAESRDPRVFAVTLTEFSDQVSRELVGDLAKTPEIQNLAGRATVVLGDLNNKTGIVTTDEFELVQARIRNNLLQSDYVRDQIRFTADRDRLGALRQREIGDVPDEQLATGLDPASTFVLIGDFYRIGRGRANQYYMEFQLVHFLDNAIVFADRYDAKQVQR